MNEDSKNTLTSIQALNEAQNRLIHGITHDFNNLVTQIYTNLEVVLLDTSLNLNSRNTIEGAINSLDQAINLLENLKIISMPISNNENVINPINIINETISKLKTTINTSITFESNIKNTVYVKIDRVSFSRILDNILDNAIFASSFSDHPCIYISAEVENSSLKIVIEDSGDGIPAHLNNLIFTPYFTTKKNNIGSGVGLSLCKAIAEANEGKVILSPNKFKLTGASFTIHFPLRASPSSTDSSAISYSPADLTGKKLLICAEESILKNHLFILNKLKNECTHFTPDSVNQCDFSSADIVIISLSSLVVKFGIVRLLKQIPSELPIIIISHNLESTSYLSELQRSKLTILDLPVTFNILSKSILKQLN